MSVEGCESGEDHSDDIPARVFCGSQAAGVLGHSRKKARMHTHTQGSPTRRRAKYVSLHIHWYEPSGDKEQLRRRRMRRRRRTEEKCKHGVR